MEKGIYLGFGRVREDRKTRHPDTRDDFGCQRIFIAFIQTNNRSFGCLFLAYCVEKSPGKFFEQISVMSTVQPIHDRAMVDVLDIRVTDLSLPVRTGPEFFQHNRRLQTVEAAV